MMHMTNVNLISLLLVCLCSTGQALRIIRANLEPHSDVTNLEFQHACKINALFGLNTRKCMYLSQARYLKDSLGKPLQNQYNVKIDQVTWTEMATELQNKPFGNFLVCVIRDSPPAIGWLLPKSASSSLRSSKALREAGFKEHFCTRFFEDGTKSHFLTDPDVVRFAVVRDPFSRFVSAFNQISLEGLGFNRSDSRKLLPPNAATDPRIRFSDFITNILVRGALHQSVFTEMQTILLLERIEKRLRLPKLNFMTSIETLEEDLPELQTLLGIESKQAKKQTYVSYGGYGGKLTTEDAVPLIKENSAATQAFCDNYVSDYVFLSKPLPSWCPPVSQRFPSSQQTEQGIAKLANFMNIQAIQILHH